MRLMYFIWLIISVSAVIILTWRSHSVLPTLDFRPVERSANNYSQDVTFPPTYISPTRQKNRESELLLRASKYGWKLYTGKRAGTSSPKFDNHMITAKLNFTPSKGIAIDDSIREGIEHRSVPFQCYPGEYSFFPPQYWKFTNLLAEYTRNESKMSNKRVLAWHCRSDYACGGIGDRLQGVLSTLALAIFSRRKFVMYWEAPGENLYLRPNMINWDDKQAIDKIKKSKKNDNNVQKRSVRIGNHRFYFNVGQKIWQSYLSTIQGDIPIVALATNIELSSLLSNYTIVGQKWVEDGLNRAGLVNLSKVDLLNLLGIAFRYLFVLKPSLTNEVKSAMKVLGIDGIPYVGLHLRTGFHGSNSVRDDPNLKYIKDRTKWTKALQCAVDRANKYTGNNSYIFLATDSPAVRDLAVSEFGLRFRTLDIGAFHVDKMNKRPHAVTSNENKGIVSMLIDVILLTQSYILVHWTSGYSHLAAVVCGIPNERNINSMTCKHY